MGQSLNNAKKIVVMIVALIFLRCTIYAQKYDEASIVQAIAKSQDKPNMSCLLGNGRGVYPSTRVFFIYIRERNTAFRKIRETFGLPQQKIEEGDTLFLIDYHRMSEFKHYTASWIHSRPQTFRVSGYYADLYMKMDDENPLFRFSPKMTRLCNDWDLSGIDFRSHEYQARDRLEYMMLTRVIFEKSGKYSIDSVPFLSWDEPESEYGPKTDEGLKHYVTM